MIYSVIDDILPREPGDDLLGLLGKLADLIDEYVNFGSHLMKWEAKKKGGGDEDLPPLMFLRNIIELADAISLLVRNSSIDPCKPLLRTLLESTFGLEYLLVEDTERRSIAFIIWNTHRELKYLDKIDSKTEAGRQFKKEIEKDKLIEDISPIFNRPNLELAKQFNLDILSKPRFSIVEEEYQRTLLRRKNPKWYALFNGPNDIERLAKHLKHHALYEYFYRMYSGNTHATSIYQEKVKRNPDGTGAIIQIRTPKDAQSVTGMTLNIFLVGLLSFGDHFLPERKTEFQTWYKSVKKSQDRLLSKQLIKIEG